MYTGELALALAAAAPASALRSLTLLCYASAPPADDPDVPFPPGGISVAAALALASVALPAALRLTLGLWNCWRHEYADAADAAGAGDADNGEERMRGALGMLPGAVRARLRLGARRLDAEDGGELVEIEQLVDPGAPPADDGGG